VPEFETTAQGSRVATSVGGVLTGRGADLIIIDDPLKPEEALSQTQRQAANEWFDHTLYSPLNDKQRVEIGAQPVPRRIWPYGISAGSAPAWPGEILRRSSMGFAPKIRFAPDSPLEGDALEPSVPSCDRPSANS
jgi:hypothetical protein